jgi:sugar O-acyltransferase (sialic acid O-acetyltransferase NeuD family)
MVIAGAGGHARELAGIFSRSNPEEQIYFFDDLSRPAPALIWNKYPVISTQEELKVCFRETPQFVVGVGNPSSRKLLFEKLTALGGIAFSLIDPSASIGTYNVNLGEGLNIMNNVVITQDVAIGKGCLVHVNVTVHHDCRIGQFCELAPGCHVLGNVTIGDLCSIGAASVLLPGVTIGDKAVVGAGAVVTRDVAPGRTVKGVPAK